MSATILQLPFITEMCFGAPLLASRPTGDYSINPISGTSLAAFLALASFALLISPLAGLPRSRRLLIAQLAAIAIAITIVLVTDGPPGGTGLWPKAERAGVYPDRLAAICVLLAFGFGFALHGLREPHTLLTFAAMFCGLFFAAFIGVEVVGKLRMMLPAKVPEQASTLAGVGCMFLWAPIAGLILNRYARPARWRRQGRCDRCGYDLRENTTNQCPECGAKDSRKP